MENQNKPAYMSYLPASMTFSRSKIDLYSWRILLSITNALRPLFKSKLAKSDPPQGKFDYNGFVSSRFKKDGSVSVKMNYVDAFTAKRGFKKRVFEAVEKMATPDSGIKLNGSLSNFSLCNPDDFSVENGWLKINISPKVASILTSSTGGFTKYVFSEAMEMNSAKMIKMYLITSHFANSKIKINPVLLGISSVKAYLSLSDKYSSTGIKRRVLDPFGKFFKEKTSVSFDVVGLKKFGRNVQGWYFSFDSKSEQISEAGQSSVVGQFDHDIAVA